MKKLLYILASSMIFAGCQKESITFTSEDRGTLEFNTSIDDMATHRVASRAISDVNFDSHGIFIAGYHTEGKIADAVAAASSGTAAVGGAVVPNIFNYDIADGQLPVPLVKKGLPGSLSPDKYTLSTVKWRLDETSYLSYFSWTQGKTKDAVSGIVAATTNADDAGYPWLDIVNPHNVNTQIDIATASYVDQPNNQVVSAVDLTFKHILSKLTFKFRSSTGASISVTKMNLTYGANMVQSKGRYTFNSDAATVGAFGGLNTPHTGTFPLGTAPYTITKGAEITAGSMLLIPQNVAKGFLRFELTYSVASGNTQITYSKSVDLPATILTGGLNHMYTIDFTDEEVVIYDALISDWITESSSRLPLVAGPRGDVKLLLDAYDTPYTNVDGKRYWLDRSGYNNHVELTAGFAAYDAVTKAYRFNTGAVGGVIPALGAMTEVTMELVATNTGTGATSNNPVMLESTTGARVWINLNYQNLNQLHLNRGNGMTTNTVMQSVYTDVNHFKKVQLYTLQWTNSKWVYYDNASIMLDLPYLGTDKLVSFTGGQVAANNFAGTINYVKITGKVLTPKEIVSTYLVVKDKFGIANESAFMPPVVHGLQFNYDGRTGVKTVGGKTYWEDQVGKNDAQIIAGAGNANPITYDPVNKCFNVSANQVAGSMGYMQMLYSVVMSNDFTAELVLKPNGRASGSPVFWGDSKTGGTGGRLFYMHLPDVGGLIYIDSPGDDRVSTEWPTGYGDETIMRKLVIRRKYKSKAESFMYNRVFLTGTANADIQNRECSIMEFGGNYWGGSLYAVRLYNRALTNEEITQNYKFDQQIYGFTDDNNY